MFAFSFLLQVFSKFFKLLEFFEARFVYHSLLSDFFVKLARASPLELVEGVGMFVPLPVAASGDRGPAIWSFLWSY